jgi:hypothetical protein
MTQNPVLFLKNFMVIRIAVLPASCGMGGMGTVLLRRKFLRVGRNFARTEASTQAREQAPPAGFS